VAHIDEKRAEILDSIPAWYSGIGHLVLINLSTLALIAGALALLEEPTWAEAALVPAALLFANVFEWWIHKGPLHHPTRLLGILYARHTKAHHVVFTDVRMEITHTRELRMVLFPPYVIPLLLVLTAPVSVGLWLLAPNLGWLFGASALAYYLLYEWLHMLHHWPRDSWLGRRRLIAWLRHPHQLHHDPSVMTKGNFNVSFPLADVIFRSTLTEQ
jgi:hypothetical protein